MAGFACYHCLYQALDAGTFSCALINALDTLGYVLIPQIYVIRMLRLLAVHTNTKQLDIKVQVDASARDDATPKDRTLTISQEYENQSAQPTATLLSVNFRHISTINDFYVALLFLGIAILANTLLAPSGYVRRVFCVCIFFSLFFLLLFFFFFLFFFQFAV